MKWTLSLFRIYAVAGVLALAVNPSVLTAKNSPTSSHRMKQLEADFSKRDRGPVFVFAHRGCWSHAPENSLEAMRSCINLGVEVAEIDVHLTKDRQLIVFHDRDLERMTNGHGQLRDHTLAELKQLRLYERDGSPHQIMGKKILTSLSIPTLRELFEVTRGRLMVNLEIKSNDRIGFTETYSAALALAREMGVENDVIWKIPSAARVYDFDLVPGFRGSTAAESVADQIVSALDTKGLKYVTPIVSPSDRPIAHQIKDLADDGISSFEVIAEVPSQWPIQGDGKLWGADQFRYMGVAVLPRWSAGFSDDVALAHPEAAWGKLLDLGMDSLMTDRPEQLIAYLKGRGLR